MGVSREWVGGVCGSGVFRRAFRDGSNGWGDWCKCVVEVVEREEGIVDNYVK